MLKKVVVISNTSFADVEYLINFGDPEILDGLNAIEINDVKLAKRLAGFLKFHDHFDIFIISKEKSVLDQIYKIYPYARLVYEVDHLYNFNKLKHDILGHHSYTVLISDGEINQLTVRQLKRHGIVVFNRVTDEVTIVRSMLAGVDGIVGKDIKELPDLNVDYGLSPFVIAHRGFHKETQENSVKASIKAHQLDADYVEMDIHMTKDNKIVVNHDATLGRTFEKDYVIKKEKLRTLQEVKMVFKEEILQEKLPLLKDFDHALVESNIGFIIESKTDSKFAMRRLARVVNTINRPVLLMSFYPYSIIHMKKYMPNIVNGIL
ncbi:MAG TPA: glycerophosphodiester phosphodiesterase, partial [Acholeplasma sp.]|nr:glycerophosphodiester phosphodiesterase [Acholeplasma sp.]